MIGIKNFDERRDIFVAAQEEEAVACAVEHWIHSAKRAIQQRGRCAVALAGGSTPRAVYRAVIESREVDWSKIWLFWSDERAHPPDHPESNYRMAMEYFQRVGIPLAQIFRMKAEAEEREAQAREYEETIRRQLGAHAFDLVLLGIGADGHTASLFPNTEALAIEDRWVVSHFVPALKAWRMTLTFPCINNSSHSVVYAWGSAKKEIVRKTLEAAVISPFPASRIGTAAHKALWIVI